MNQSAPPRNECGQPPAPGPAGSALTADQDRDGSTFFRCGGCGTAAVFVQRERSYGRLVHDFFDQHELCGGAVEISAARPREQTPQASV